VTSLGYSVISASTGEEAIELFTRRRDEIDLVLVDIVMPGKGGRDVYDAVRAAGSDVPIVFMTGYSAEMTPNALAAETGCRVLYKPYDLSAVAAVIRDVVEGAGV